MRKMNRFQFVCSVDAKSDENEPRIGLDPIFAWMVVVELKDLKSNMTRNKEGVVFTSMRDRGREGSNA